ncbi:MAG: hypothetical protein Q9207_004324 [Kuettlingeria erythrocarpa]
MSESNKNRWSEQEKNALLISLLAAAGSPNWKTVKLPAGRSKMACQHVYMAAVKEAQCAAFGDNSNADAVKKRGPNKKSTTQKATSTPKRKRGEHKDYSAHESEASGDEDRASKKPKPDGQSEDEKQVKLEAEEV